MMKNIATIKFVYLFTWLFIYVLKLLFFPPFPWVEIFSVMCIHLTEGEISISATTFVQVTGSTDF